MFIRKIRQHKLLHWPDEQLIQAFRQTGEQVYFTELFGRYTHLVYLVACKYLGQGEEARDLVLEIFQKVFERLPDTTVLDFSNWLYVLVRNDCIQRLRQQNRHALGLAQWQDRQKSESDFMENEGFRRLINESEREISGVLDMAIAALEEEQRLCLHLFFYEKKSYREIAARIQIPENQVKSKLQNGKRLLKKKLIELLNARE